jgi:hypothetical protein
MEMSIVEIAPRTGPARIDAEWLTRLLHRDARPADGLEHLRVRAGPYRTVIVGFLMPSGPVDARTTLCSLVERTLAGAPELRHWRIV